MAKDEEKRKRKRKQRTGDDYDDAEKPKTAKSSKKSNEIEDTQKVDETFAEKESNVAHEVPEILETKPQSSTDADFESWYLRSITAELQEDLDKLRNASDFKDNALPILIAALKQGATLFSEEEKSLILGKVITL